MDAPEMVRDLRVARSGADLVLSWSPVTTTILGEPFTATGHAVHEAARPDFVADDATVVARPSGTSARLPDRVGDGRAVEWLAVRAVGSAGAGAACHDFPQGVGAFDEVFDATTVELSWSPVLHDISGAPTPITRYHVYASPSGPLSRSDVEALLPAAVVEETRAVLDRSLGDHHFVVAEDVHGNRSAY
jgi:hypothetical protein